MVSSAFKAATGHHAAELDTLSQALRVGPRAADSARAVRLIHRIRSVEAATGQSLTDLLDALERSAQLHIVGDADRLTEEQAAALASVGADFSDHGIAQRPSLVTDLAYRRLLDRALTTADAAELLHVSESRIRQRLAARTLLATRIGGAHRLPRFQFTDRGELPGWRLIAPAIPERLPLAAVARFMSTPQVDLVIDDEATSPADWLRAGGLPAAVIELISE